MRPFHGVDALTVRSVNASFRYRHEHQTIGEEHRMPSLQSLLDQVEQATNEIVELEQSLVRIPSVNTGFMPTGGETAVAEFVRDWAIE